MKFDVSLEQKRALAMAAAFLVMSVTQLMSPMTATAAQTKAKSETTIGETNREIEGAADQEAPKEDIGERVDAETELTEQRHSSPSTVPKKAADKNATKESNQTPDESTDEKQKSVERGLDPIPHRSFLGLANVSPFDLVVPFKWGLTIGADPSTCTICPWSSDSSLSLSRSFVELEYLRGTVAVPVYIEDVGKATETRISLIRRSFVRKGSFNWFYGLSYFDLHLKAGSEILATVTGQPLVDHVRVRSLGAIVGIGNRWTVHRRFLVGVDWISWAQPLLLLEKDTSLTRYLNNERQRSDLDAAIRVGSYIPRITLLRLQAGAEF